MGVSGRGSGTFPSPVLGTTTALPTGPFPHLQIPDPTQHLTSVAAFPSAPLLAASSASLKTNIFVLGVAHSNTTGAAAGSATSSNNDISPTNGLGSNTSLAGGAGSGKDANGLRMVLLSTISLPHAALHLAFSPGRTNNDGAHDLLSSSHSGRVLHLRVTPGKGTVRPQVEWLREIPCFPNPQTVAAKPGRMAPSSRVQKSLFFGVPGQSLPTGLSFASISGPTVATWDLQQASGSSIAAFPNNDDSLLGLATVQARTDIVATSSAGGALMLVDLRVGDSGSPGGHGLSKAAVWSVKRAHGPRSIPTVAFHPAGSYLASGGEDGTVRVWDVRYAGSTIPVANDEETGYVNYVAASGKESAGGRITDVGLDLRGAVRWTWTLISHSLSASDPLVPLATAHLDICRLGPNRPHRLHPTLCPGTPTRLATIPLFGRRRRPLRSGRRRRRRGRINKCLNGCRRGRRRRALDGPLGSTLVVLYPCCSGR